MKRKVYVETSVISYLAARPSKTILGAAHQQITAAWWDTRLLYELYVSRLVWQECAAGDPDAAKKRLTILEDLGILVVNEQAAVISEDLVNESILPSKAVEDALHIAIAIVHGMDFLLTWNCKHIANPIIQENIAAYLAPKGLSLPFICTPEELLGADDHE